MTGGLFFNKNASCPPGPPVERSWEWLSLGLGSGCRSNQSQRLTRIGTCVHDGRMLRMLVLVLAMAVAVTGAAAQTQTVLHIKVAVKDADGRSTPVPRYLLLVSDNPPTAPPRRVMTALDGSADVRLRPGNYTIESDQPFAFQGRSLLVDADPRRRSRP